MLLAPVPSTSPQHPSFQVLSQEAPYVGTRQMIESVFEDFEDADGNFVEQFQTTGFDARFFELYLQAMLSEQGFTIARPKPNPDFLATRGDLTIALEATTTNPSRSGVLAEHGHKLAELDARGLEAYLRDEFPIRLGSALTSKLAKKYWTTPQCSGRPFILAIEAFHDDGSLGLSDFALERYLYGLDYSNPQFADGVLHADIASVASFSVGPKKIPGPFFSLPETENVSAVLFTNQGTSAKFTRMAHSAGYKNDFCNIRVCDCLDPDPSSVDPSMFVYDLDEPLFEELWTHGIVLYHNPRALRPLEDDVFPGAAEIRFVQGRLFRKFQEYHIYSSKTLHLPRTGSRSAGAPRGVGVSTAAAQQLQIRPPKPFVIDQWFATTTGAAGVLLRDGERWTSGVIRRQGLGFALEPAPLVLASRDAARLMLQRKLLTVSAGTDTVSTFCTQVLAVPEYPPSARPSKKRVRKSKPRRSKRR